MALFIAYVPRENLVHRDGWLRMALTFSPGLAERTDKGRIFSDGREMATVDLASSADRTGSGGGVSGRDKRVDERFDLERAPGTLVHKGRSIPCEMLDVSLSGCRVHTLQPFTAGALESVKVVLAIHGMVLSIWGITQWTQW